MFKKPQVLQLLAASIALAVGILVYVLDRQPEHIYFLPEYLSLADGFGQFFGQLGNHLPTFVHVYAFILLTTAVLRPRTQHVLLICLIWFSIDSLFEFAQHTAVASWIAPALPTWLDGILILENSTNYFQAGRFDWFDILSIAIGSLAAYLTTLVSYYKESENVIQY